MRAFWKSSIRVMIIFATVSMHVSVSAEDAVEPLYDANGNLVQSVSGNKAEVQSEYDSTGKLIREHFDDGRTINYDGEVGAEQE